MSWNVCESLDQDCEQQLLALEIHTNLCLHPFLWPRCTLASNRSFKEKSSDTRKKSGFSSGRVIIFSVKRHETTLMKDWRRTEETQHGWHGPGVLLLVSRLTCKLLLGLRRLDGRRGGRLVCSARVSDCNDPRGSKPQKAWIQDTNIGQNVQTSARQERSVS